MIHDMNIWNRRLKQCVEMWSLSCAVLTLSLCTATMFGQTKSSTLMLSHAPNIVFNHITVEQGLSQNTVYASLQDRQGFLWFGTADGLNRYDGYGFVVFRRTGTDSTSLSNSFVQALAEDSQGMLWIGTKDGGLNRLNPHTRVVSVFRAARERPRTSATAPPNELAHNNVTALRMSRDGHTLWIGTDGGGVQSLDAQNLSQGFRTWQMPTQHNALTKRVFCLLEDAEGCMLVGTAHGLYRLNPKTSTWEMLPHLGLGTTVAATATPSSPLHSAPNSRLSAATSVTPKSAPIFSASAQRIWALCQDAFGDLWIGTEAGLYRMNQTTRAVKAYRHAPTDAHSLGSDVVQVLYQDAQLRLWVGSTNGVSIFDRQTDAFFNYQRRPNSLHSLATDAIYSITQDRSGMMWIGSYGGGLNTYHDNVAQFTTYGYDPMNPQSLSANSISALCEDRTGTLWVGTWVSGINRFDREQRTNTGDMGVFTQIMHNALNPRSPKSLSDRFVRCIYEDRRGRLWIATAGGIDVLDPRTTSVVQRYAHEPNNPNALGSNNVFTITEASNGAIWVGTLDAGVHRLTFTNEHPNGVWTQYRHRAADTTTLSNDIVRCLAEDADGMMWIGTRGGGLNKLNPRTGVCTHYRHDERNPSSLSADALFSLYFDPNGTLWIGTQGGGLCRFDRRTATFDAVREHDGLANDVVYGVVEDTHETLWLSGNKGLTRVHRPSLEAALVERRSKQQPLVQIVQKLFRCYDARDGLQSNEFNAGAYHRGRSGRLYFGGVLGLNEFYPDSIRTNALVPPVVITAFKLFNKPLDVQTQTNAGAMPLVCLRYNDNFFSIEFAALNTLLPERNRYRYKLDGFDHDWMELQGIKREVSYTNLDDGEYTFYVRGSNNDGVWNLNGAAMKIRIMPPWWRTWWFRSIATLLVVGGLYGVYKLRTRRIERLAKRLEYEVHVRTAELTERNDQLHNANEEIQRQITVLDEQTREIEVANAALQEKNLELEDARQQSDALLLNVLPKTIADRLKAGEQTIADCFDDVTVLFADIVGFTVLSSQREPFEIVQLLNRIFSAFDMFSEQYGLEKIKTIGDAYMIVGGLPEPREDHAEAVASMAIEMQQTVELLATTMNLPLHIRIGIHTGQAVAGVIGQKKFSYDLWGDTVNTASRLESHGVAGKIHITEQVAERLGGKFVVEERGEIDIKGKGTMRTFFLVARAYGDK
jgi:ligand-binding sensor domain-containing protein/class 3 adenylate cyclase